MTKEELEKEAREDVDSLNSIDLVSSTMIAIDKYGAYKLGRYDGYLVSAEPREKQIADLEEKLANADYQLEGRDNEIRELETQIEKMKCCVVSCCEGCERLPKLYKEFENGNKEM